MTSSTPSSSSRGLSAAFAASMALYCVLITLAGVLGILPRAGHAGIVEWLMAGIGLMLVLEASLRAITVLLEPAIWKAILGIFLLGGALATGIGARFEAMWPFGLIALGLIGTLRTISGVVHHR
ncbi:MAG: hypothetical protein IT326_09045 [Anaerolineae bacterium]|nr:hypothetical protein [Anaerolineae bacterium]